MIKHALNSIYSMCNTASLSFICKLSHGISFGLLYDSLILSILSLHLITLIKSVTFSSNDITFDVQRAVLQWSDLDLRRGCGSQLLYQQ